MNVFSHWYIRARMTVGDAGKKIGINVKLYDLRKHSF